MSDEFAVRVDGATIPVVRAGRGRPLILCPGLLRRDHEVYSFDLRGHGVSGAADRYTVAGFLADVTAVVTRVRGRSAVAPLLVGYSLGADLVVHYASEHPGAAAELVLLDGANPVREPFVTDDDLPEFRAMFEDVAAWTASVADTPTGYCSPPRTSSPSIGRSTRCARRSCPASRGSSARSGWSCRPRWPVTTATTAPDGEI
ncbi:alpha/beta fold hydrolase [Nocardia farcinica]|nr:alpha/beta fold hydrolase [Nocardia farcinica]